MSRRFTTILLIVLVLVCLSGIGVVFMGGGQAVAPYSYQLYSTNAALPPVNVVPTSAPLPSDQPVAYKADQPQQRMVVKDATLRLVVNNPQDTLNNIVKMADDLGGWVVSSTSYQTGSGSGVASAATQAQAVIRVPAEKLTPAMDQIKAGAVSVEQETITGTDVTREYTDLNSQLTNLQAAEAQLRKIMDGAANTDNVLAVYQQLVKVRGDIEVAKGQMQYYQEAAAFSSITITLQASEQGKPIEIAGWRPLDTARNALAALVSLLQLLVNVLIWLIVVGLPFVVIFGVPAWVVARITRRWRARTPAPKPADPAEI